MLYYVQILVDRFVNPKIVENFIYDIASISQSLYIAIINNNEIYRIVIHFLKVAKVLINFAKLIKFYR